MLRQLKFVHRPDRGFDQTENNFDPKPLAYHAGAVASELICIREIGVPARIEFLLIDIRNKAFSQSRRLFAG